MLMKFTTVLVYLAQGESYFYLALVVVGAVVDVVVVGALRPHCK